jgi:plastocyanin
LKRTLLIGFLVSLLLISGCTAPPKEIAPVDTAVLPVKTAPLPVKTAPPPEETTVSSPMTATVEIEDFGFFPPELVIARGGTVTWRQKDYEKHTVTGSGFDSRELSKDQKFSHTFNESGVYEYKSSLDPSMKGKIIVK